MAVPVGQRSKPSFISTLLAWLRTLSIALVRPLFALLLALLVGGIIIMVTSAGTVIERFFDAVTAYQYLITGSYGDPQSISYSLVVVTSLIFAGLSVSIAYRAGLFNIGAAGQLAVGALVAGVLAFEFPNWPGFMLVPAMIMASALAGALWGSIVGWLKAWRGAHEVVTTIMLNWIAFFGADFLIDGPLQGPHLTEQTVPLPQQATLPLLSTLYNQTLGTFLPKIASPLSYVLDISIVFALIALVVYWFITERTTFGYELRVQGQNPRAAQYAGIAVKKNLVLTMALAGAFAGLAGSLYLMGQSPHQLIATSFAANSTGFDAIGVALLGRMTPVGVLLAALLFGGLQQASPNMQYFARVPADLTYILQALVLFSIAAEFWPTIQRLRIKMRMRRKVALASGQAGSVPTSIAMNEEQAQFAEIANVGDTEHPENTPIRGQED